MERKMFTKLLLIIANDLRMKSINEKAPVVCKKTITIEASSEAVWATLSSINNWASWQSDIHHSQLNGELKQGTTFDWKTGGAKIHSTLHTVKSNKQIGWTGKTFGMFAIHNWTLTETNGTTKVRVDESMEGFIAGLFKKFFNKNLELGMQNWLNLLKAECEKHSSHVLSTKY
jgi:hypothetical protein